MVGTHIREDGLTVGFAGTPAFAARALERVVEAGFSVALVLTRPDKPKGRGQRLEVSAVKSVAQTRGIGVLQPPTLRSPEVVADLRKTPLDVLVVAAYGLILPPDVLGWPRYGCVNIHASLLPRWRGAAPIQRAIEAGDRSTGISIMRMDAGLDTGPVVDRHEIDIGARESAGSLQERLADLGAAMIVTTLERLQRDRALAAVPQPEAGASYARKIERDEARIDWREDASVLDRRIRAFDPDPGAYTLLSGSRLKVHAAMPIDGPGAGPGTLVAVSAAGLDVACGRGTLRLLEVQPAGGRRMGVAAFLAGRALSPGERFDGDDRR